MSIMVNYNYCLRYNIVHIIGNGAHIELVREAMEAGIRAE